MKLTNEEYNVLNKISARTKMDCWFCLSESGDEDIVLDLENRNFLTLKEGVSMLFEGLDCPENIESCDLTDEEKATFNALLEKLGVEGAI